LLPHLVHGKYEIIHYIDPPLGNFLYRLRDNFKLGYKMIYTNGVGMSPRHYERPDHIHQMSQAHYQTALDHGIPQTRMTMLPSGVNSSRLLSAAGKQAVRRKYGVPEDAFVVLSVSAINRSHKRIDYLVQEIAALSNKCLLWVDGHPEDASILNLVAERLGSNCRITHVSSQSVGDLYQLADLFVLASLEEGFGIAVVEAMYSGLPVLVHRNPHFMWLVGNEACLVDMEHEGNLATRIAQLMDHSSELDVIARANAAKARRRFDWAYLKAEYVEMYRRLSSRQNSS
jgi:glycosyltransferase involved in cell wall biosynthesis